MTKEQIFNYFYTNNANFGVRDLLFTLASGLVIALLIYLTYWVTYRGVSYNRRFNQSLVVILLISVVIMLMISSNIVISLGMVGALSIVRFRTAVKDSRDTVFIFWAIAEGLCVGSQNNQLALITTLCIGLVLMLGSIVPAGRNRYLVVVRGGAVEIDQNELTKKIKPFVRSTRIRSISRAQDHTEMILEVRARKSLTLRLAGSLAEVEGVESVNWISEAGEAIG